MVVEGCQPTPWVVIATLQLLILESLRQLTPSLSQEHLQQSTSGCWSWCVEEPRDMVHLVLVIQPYEYLVYTQIVCM